MSGRVDSPSITEHAAAVASAPVQRRAPKPASRKPYATAVFLLATASTLVAMFDLVLFATGALN
jgi:hypothetical protein